MARGVYGRPRQRVGRFAPRNVPAIYAPLPPEIYSPSEADNPAPSDFVTSVNTIAWLTPSSMNSAVDGFTWTDQSGYQNHFYCGAQQAPTLVTAWLDGNSGAQFDGLEQILWCPVMRGLAKGGKPCAIVVANGDVTQPQTAGYLMVATKQEVYAPLADQRMWRLEHRDNRTSSIAQLGAAAEVCDARAAASLGAPHWYLMKSCNAIGKPEVWIDGTLAATAPEVGSTDGLSATLTMCSLGGGRRSTANNLDNSWKGVFGELIIFDGEPTVPELEALLSDLQAPRWPSLSWVLS